MDKDKERRFVTDSNQFDVNECLRSTACNVAIFPTSERKGRSKAMFIVMRPMAYELYKQKKDADNKKSAKHTIEFEYLFNISLQKEPNHFKNDVLVLMTPTATYYIDPHDVGVTVKDWFDLALERICPARSDRILRPVYREDFWEAAWDVIAVKKPKLRKEVKSEKFHDLVEATADIQGRRRFCITPTSYLLFKMNILANAAPDLDQLYDKSSYYEFPINVVANYGKQEKYFFFRLGRYSDMGAGEIWLNCDSGNTAKEVHDTIGRIYEREAEKRKVNGIVLPLGAISSRVIKSKQHRERAAENRKRAAEAKEGKTPEGDGLDGAQLDPNAVESSATSPKSDKLEKKVRHSSGGSSKLTSTMKFPFVGDMAHKITSKLHYSSSSNSPGLFITNPEFNDPYTAGEMFSQTLAAQKGFGTSTTPEQTHGSDVPEQSNSMLLPHKSNSVYNDADDYMPYDARVDSRKCSAVNSAPIRQVSVMSNTESAPMATPSTIADLHSDDSLLPAAFLPRFVPEPELDVPNDYQFMGVGVPIDNSLKFAIKETRTYVSDVSDSTESCISTAKRPKRDQYDSSELRPSPSPLIDDPSHSQRAFSLGSRPFNKILPLAFQNGMVPVGSSSSAHQIGDSDVGDIRKRAHSAGSKTWNIALHHRKTGGDPQGNFTDVMRSRTGSMGTGTKRPFPRPHDHIEMDWSDGSKQGSIASLDSPNCRSRNSSIGVSMSANVRMAAESARKSIVDKAAEKLAACKVEPRWDEFTYPPTGSPHFRSYPDGGRRQSTTDNDEDYVPISVTASGVGTSAKKNVQRVINTIMESDNSDNEMMPIVDLYAPSPSGTPMPPVPLPTPIPTISPLPPITPGLGSAKSNLIEYSFLVPTSEPSPTTRSGAPSPLPVQAYVPASPGNVSKGSEGRESSTVSDDGSIAAEGSGNKCEYAVINLNDK